MIEILQMKCLFWLVIKDEGIRVKVEGLLKELRDNSSFAKKILLGISGAIFGIIITYIYYPKITYRIGIISTPSIYEKIVVYELKNVDKVKKINYMYLLFQRILPTIKRERFL